MKSCISNWNKSAFSKQCLPGMLWQWLIICFIWLWHSSTMRWSHSPLRLKDRVASGILTLSFCGNLHSLHFCHISLVKTVHPLPAFSLCPRDNTGWMIGYLAVCHLIVSFPFSILILTLLEVRKKKWFFSVVFFLKRKGFNGVLVSFPLLLPAFLGCLRVNVIVYFY